MHVHVHVFVFGCICKIYTRTHVCTRMYCINPPGSTMPLIPCLQQPDTPTPNHPPTHLVPHGACMQYGLMSHGGECLMGMHQGCTFSQEDVAKEAKGPHKCGEGVLLVEWQAWDVVHLHVGVWTGVVDKCG